MYCMIGLRNAHKDIVRAAPCYTWSPVFTYQLCTWYPKRSSVLLLILNGEIIDLQPTFLTTKYTRGKGSKFYSTAEQLVYENPFCDYFYVIDTDNRWYVCTGDPRTWIEVKI